MAKKADEQEAKPLEWFGADIEQDRDGNRTTAVLDGFKGVDSDVPKTRTADDGVTLTRVLVRKPAPGPMGMRVRTSVPDKNKKIGELTARYKLMRSAFQFAPMADKDMWEKRRDIAYHEMQVARFQQKLDKVDKATNPNQYRALRRKVNEHRGELAELMGVI